MMKRVFIAVILFAGIAADSLAQDYPKIAKEYCQCFEILKDSMSAENRELLIKIASDSDIRTALVRETSKLSLEKRQQFSIELSNIGMMMESDTNPAGECGLKLDDIYREYNNTPEKEKLFSEKLMAALKEMPGCVFFDAVLKIALAFSDEEE